MQFRVTVFYNLNLLEQNKNEENLFNQALLKPPTLIKYFHSKRYHFVNCYIIQSLLGNSSFKQLLMSPAIVLINVICPSYQVSYLFYEFKLFSLCFKKKVFSLRVAQTSNSYNITNPEYGRMFFIYIQKLLTSGNHKLANIRVQKTIIPSICMCVSSSLVINTIIEDQ